MAEAGPLITDDEVDALQSDNSPEPTHDSVEHPDQPTNADPSAEQAAPGPDFDADTEAEAEREALRRAAGRVPGLQSRIDRLEARLQKMTEDAGARQPGPGTEDISALTEAIDAVVNSLSEVLTPEQVAALRQPLARRREAAERAQWLEAELAKRGVKPAPSAADGTGESQTPPQSGAAPWEQADRAVQAYAAEVGFDIGSIGETLYRSVVERARKASDTDAGQAEYAEALLKAHIRRQVAASAGRADKAAASGRSPRGGNTGTNTKRIYTKDQFERLTRAEVDALPWEVVENSMRSWAATS